MEPKGESISGRKIAAFIMGGIFVVIFLALIFTNSSSPSNSNTQGTSTTTTISGNQNSNSQNQTPPPQVVQNNNSQSGNSSQITATDIAPYLTGVMEVICSRMNANGVEQVNDTGSGSLWRFPNGTYNVVTNEHVITGNDSCGLFNTNIGVYSLDLSNVRTWNSMADEAVIPIVLPTGNTKNLTPIDQLNYSISSLRYCPASMPQDSPVIVVGYPAFSSMMGIYNPENMTKNEITTNGTISGYDSSPKNDGLPDSNYYISATIDSGNSGGVAFSKNADGLCLLGIPTWITLTGNFTNEGIVQNIHNVTYSQ
jgi:hypothetical protein